MELTDEDVISLVRHFSQPLGNAVARLIQEKDVELAELRREVARLREDAKRAEDH